jgi:hypothetical protein
MASLMKRTSGALTVAARAGSAQTLETLEKVLEIPGA